MSSHPRPQVIETVAGMRDVVAHERSAGRTVALTPTLGALHQGHLAHVERAAELADVRIVSIFVNPTQFGANEDLEKYPRTMDEDLDMLGTLGVPYVFAPSVEEMYPKGPTSTTISAGQIGTMFEGKTRPGHFDAVLTVVAKASPYRAAISSWMPASVRQHPFCRLLSKRRPRPPIVASMLSLRRRRVR